MMSEAIIHGIILAFGLIIPLGVQNVLSLTKVRANQTFGGQPRNINCLYM